MTNKGKPYKTFTKEFKQEAVRLLEGAGRPAAEIAMELGIRRNQLYKLKEQLQDKNKDTQHFFDSSLMPYWSDFHR